MKKVTSPAYEVLDAGEARLGGDELETLLHQVYAGEGFTDPAAAKTLFAACAVRRRGWLLFVRDASALLGTIIVVPPGSPACRVARDGEAEMQLLAVSPAARNAGIGRVLIDAALQRARNEGYSRMVLRTQPTMHAAHRLYEHVGFLRAPERDVEEDGRAFLVYEMRL